MQHRAMVTRDGDWWMISFAEIDGLTQARRLSEVSLMAREYIAACTEVEVDDVDVDLEFSLPTPSELGEAPRLASRIAVDPDIMHGRPRVSGTRARDIRACVEFVATRAQHAISG